MSPEGPVAVVEGSGRQASVHAALLLTGVVGGVVFAGLMIASAGVYDAVSEADGVSGLDKPVLDAAMGQRSPALDAWVTAFTNLGHHWLTDVMFAWLFGSAWLALLITVHQVVLRRSRPRALQQD